MSTILPSKKANKWWMNLKGNCGHHYNRPIWTYGVSDAKETMEWLETLPCDNCLVAMTKINNQLAEVMDAQQ